jgi:hypothetical protein
LIEQTKVINEDGPQGQQLREEGVLQNASIELTTRTKNLTEFALAGPSPVAVHSEGRSQSDRLLAA